ncbi:MAG TPA: hypothetical protein VH951_12840, partial [Dehalococcoidia bacterium]
KHSIEAKYVALGLALLGGLHAMQQMGLLDFAQRLNQAFVGFIADVGFIGIFLIAAVPNALPMVHIPETLPVVSLALSGASLNTMLWAGVWAGLGCAVGETISYCLAYKVLGANESMKDSGLYRWVMRNVAAHPRIVPAVIFIFAATPLPDDCVIIPLAMMRYGLRRVLPPLFAGKIIHTIVVAALIYFLSDSFRNTTSAGAGLDATLLLLVVFVLGIFYQAEKSRHSAGQVAHEATSAC